jgi:hypothetical protein
LRYGAHAFASLHAHVRCVWLQMDHEMVVVASADSGRPRYRDDGSAVQGADDTDIDVSLSPDVENDGATTDGGSSDDNDDDSDGDTAALAGSSRGAAVRTGALMSRV